MNSRVFALFFAHGFGLRDMITALYLHLLPAFGFSVFFMITSVSVLWIFFWSALPQDIGSLDQMRNEAIVLSLVLLLAGAAIATWLVTLDWWRQTRVRLKTILQD